MIPRPIVERLVLGTSHYGGFLTGTVTVILAAAIAAVGAFIVIKRVVEAIGAVL